MISSANCPVFQVEQNGSTLTFHFDTIYLREVVKYCITVFEDNYRSCLFFMEKKDEKWKIINAPQIEGKFFRLEGLLSNFLEEFGHKESDVDSNGNSSCKKGDDQIFKPAYVND